MARSSRASHSVKGIAAAALSAFRGSRHSQSMGVCNRPKLHKMRSTLQKGVITDDTGVASQPGKLRQLGRWMSQHQNASLATSQMALRNGGASSIKLVEATKNFDVRVQFKLIVDVPRSSPLASLVYMIITITNFGVIANLLWASFEDQTMLNSVFVAENETVRRTVIRLVEQVCTGVFTFELLTRIIIGTIDMKVMLAMSINFWIDVVSTLPMYVELITGAIAPNVTPTQIPALLTITLLMRIFRVLKLLRYYAGLPVLAHALKRCLRAVMVPLVGIAVAIVLLGSALFIVERDLTGGDDHGFANLFAAMQVTFWMVIALGYEGDMGKDTLGGQLVLMMAIMAGIVFTTMPITIIGEAFASAWEEKEKLEVAIRMQELLFERGLNRAQLKTVFEDFDESGDGGLDWEEFKAALKTLNIQLPVKEMRHLFTLFDKDGEGTVSYQEFSEAIFPDIDWNVEEVEEERRKSAAEQISAAEQMEKLAEHANQVPGAAMAFMVEAARAAHEHHNQSARSEVSERADGAATDKANQDPVPVSARKVSFEEENPGAGAATTDGPSTPSSRAPMTPRGDGTTDYHERLAKAKKSLLREKVRKKVIPASRLMSSRLAAERGEVTELLRHSGRGSKKRMAVSVGQMSFEVGQLMSGQVDMEKRLANIERMLAKLFPPEPPPDTASVEEEPMRVSTMSTAE